MANNINREGFKRFLELGAPSFEGNIILDSGELSEYYYRFMRIPLAYGEHKPTHRAVVNQPHVKDMD